MTARDWKYFLLAWALVALCALPAIVWGKPPQELAEHLVSLRMVHEGRCDMPSQNFKNVECLILVEDATDTLWLLFYTDDIKLTHVYTVKDKKETLVWSNASV